MEKHLRKIDEHGVKIASRREGKEGLVQAVGRTFGVQSLR
jgi:hypothetical protein